MKMFDMFHRLQLDNKCR